MRQQRHWSRSRYKLNYGKPAPFTAVSLEKSNSENAMYEI
jgi:hypothetical protein